MSNYKKEKPKPHGLACCANCKYYNYNHDETDYTYCCKLDTTLHTTRVIWLYPDPWDICEDWEMEPY